MPTSMTPRAKPLNMSRTTSAIEPGRILYFFIICSFFLLLPSCPTGRVFNLYANFLALHMARSIASSPFPAIVHMFCCHEGSPLFSTTKFLFFPLFHWCIYTLLSANLTVCPDTLTKSFGQRIFSYPFPAFQLSSFSVTSILRFRLPNPQNRFPFLFIVCIILYLFEFVKVYFQFSPTILARKSETARLILVSNKSL